MRVFMFVRLGNKGFVIRNGRSYFFGITRLPRQNGWRRSHSLFHSRIHVQVHEEQIDRVRYAMGDGGNAQVTAASQVQRSQQ